MYDQLLLFKYAFFVLRYQFCFSFTLEVEDVLFFLMASWLHQAKKIMCDIRNISKNIESVGRDSFYFEYFFYFYQTNIFLFSQKTDKNQNKKTFGERIIHDLSVIKLPL